MKSAMRLTIILTLAALFAPPASAQTENERDIAARYAPVFYQALGDKPRSDHITNFDFDGDWLGNNNWENTDNKKFPLRAFVYYALSETRTHYFIHYAVFHPRDYKGGTTKGIILSELIRVGAAAAGENDPTGLAKTVTVAHENDMEGALVVVDKAAQRVEFVETLQHNNFNTYRGTDAKGGSQRFKTEDKRVLLYVEPKGHGVHAFTDEKQAGKKFLVYRFTGKADDPDKTKKGPVGYDLLPIATTLWPRVGGVTKENASTFGATHDFGEISISVLQSNGSVAARAIKLGSIGAAFFGDSGGLNMARPPWGWFDNRRTDPLGLWFFDPATVVKRDFKLADSFSTTYTRLPFWAN